MIKRTRSGKRFTPITISASSDPKKFTRKDLEGACRKLTPSRNEISIVKTQLAKHHSLATQSNSDATSQIKSLDAGVKICARKYNESKAQGDQLEEELRKKLDEKSELEREANILQGMILGNNEDAKKITKLNEEIDKANTCAEAKLRYRLQLNHMHQRQRKNSIAVDAHMSAMTSTLLSAERERQRCKKMLGEIDSGVATATHDLEAAAREIDVERAERERAINGKKTEVDNSERLEEWRKSQELNRRNFEQALGGRYQVEKVNKLHKIQELEDELKILSKTTEAISSGQGSSEEAFMHIKRATGVNSLSEMVEKLTHHQEQCNRLQNEKIEAEECLSNTKSCLVETIDNFNRLKANGFEGTDLSREIISDITEGIESERTQVKVMTSTNARLEGVLVGLRQGGMGLYQRLLPFHPTLLDGDAPTLNESVTASAIQAAHDTLEMLKVAQQILGKMVSAIGGVDKLNEKNVSHSPTFSRKEPLSDFENPNLGERNCRIRASKVRKERLPKFL